MHKISFIFFKLLFWLPFFALSQVGIGTVTPNAQLDIQSSNPSAPASNDGILIPKINEFPAIDPSAAQDGMMVYATGSGSVAKGFYYWNQSTTSWVTIVGSAGTIEKLDDLSDGKSDAAGSTVFLGEGAGLNDDGSTNYNVGIGFDALRESSGTGGNVAVGANALRSQISGGANVAMGFNALASLSNGITNTSIGAWSMPISTTGNANASLGAYTLRNNTTGNTNVAIGYSALFANTGGNSNIAIGGFALEDLTSGISNIGLGYATGANNTTGNRNVFIGNNAGANSTGSDLLIIESSTYPEPNPLIYGEFDNDLLRVNGTLNINNQ